jgi:hypothetical protein
MRPDSLVLACHALRSIACSLNNNYRIRAAACNVHILTCVTLGGNEKGVRFHAELPDKDAQCSVLCNATIITSYYDPKVLNPPNKIDEVLSQESSHPYIFKFNYEPYFILRLQSGGLPLSGSS